MDTEGLRRGQASRRASRAARRAGRCGEGRSQKPERDGWTFFQKAIPTQPKRRNASGRSRIKECDENKAGGRRKPVARGFRHKDSATTRGAGMLMFAQSSPKFFRLLFVVLAAAGLARTAAAAQDESAPLASRQRSARENRRPAKRFAARREVREDHRTQEPHLDGLRLRSRSRPRDQSRHASQRDSRPRADAGRHVAGPRRRKEHLVHRSKSSSSATSGTCRPISRTCFPATP